MTTRIFGRTLLCAGIVGLLALLLPSAAWAHRCGLPYQLKMNKGDTVEYAVTGGHPIDYVVVDMGNNGVATIEPAKIHQEGDGYFKIMGAGKGTTEFTIEWEGVTRRGRCNVEVTVAE